MLDYTGVVIGEVAEDAEDEFNTDVPEVLKTTGWSVTIGDDLPNCSHEIISKGEFVCLSPIDKGRTEQCVIATRCELPGVAVDWHWSRNKIVVRCLRGEPAKVKKAFLEHCRQEMLKRVKESAFIERRAEVAGKPFNTRWERNPNDEQMAA